jgi:hypothetical protein
MPARTLFWDQLDDAGRTQVRQAIEGKPLLSEWGVASAAWLWALLALLGAGLAAVAWLWGLGSLEVPTYALGALFAVRGIAGTVDATAKKTPWTPILALHAFGVLDARSRRIRVLPIADLESARVERNQGGPSGLTYFVTHLRFHGGDEVLFRLFGTERTFPASDIAALGKGVAPEVPLPAGEASAPPRPRPLWLISLAAAIAVVAAGYGLLLPARAAKANEDRRQRYAAARASITHPELRRLLDELERRGNPTVIVDCDHPPREQLDAATKWLEAKAKASGLGSVPVMVHYPSGDVAGEEVMQRLLGEALEKQVPRAILRLERRHDALPQEAPRLAVSFDLAPTAAYQLEGGTRLYAGFDLTYAVSLEIAGTPPVVLVSGVKVPAPDSLEVTRLAFKGETLPTLGESGNLYDDVLVYTELVDHAATEAAPKLAAQLFR